MNKAQLIGQDDSHIYWLSDHIGLHHEMKSAWQALSAAAKLAGFELKIASGYRSFDRQLSIWNRKFSGELAIKGHQGETMTSNALTDDEKITAILLYSALPGASRHHWGSDLDIYADNLLPEDQTLQLEPWEYGQEGPFYALSQWLEKNAHSYGFYLPYDIYRGGVAAEPWHISYFPIAKLCQNQLSLRLISEVIANSNILGKENILLKLTDIFNQYVQNIRNIDLG